MGSSGVGGGGDLSIGGALQGRTRRWDFIGTCGHGHVLYVRHMKKEVPVTRLAKVNVQEPSFMSTAESPSSPSKGSGIMVGWVGASEFPQEGLGATE